MGYCKVVVEDDGKRVRLVHQLDQYGEAYAEDIVVEVQPGVSAERLSYLTTQDGKIGTASYIFHAVDPQPEGILFP